MLSTFEIIIIVVFIIAILVSVYFLTRPKKDTTPPKSAIQLLIDDALSAFGIKVKETFKQERFADTPIFNDIDDIPKNMPTFIKYAFPRLDMNEVNALLKSYNITKTAEDILDENKGLTYDQFTSNDKFGSIIELLQFYTNIIFDDSDNNNVMDSLRLANIIIIAIMGLKMKKGSKLPQSKFPYNGEEYNLTDIDFELPEDFELTNYLKIYLVTNLNQDKQDNDTKIDTKVLDTTIGDVAECLTTKLCNFNIKIGDFEEQKNIAIANMIDIKRMFLLVFVGNLLDLDGIPLPQSLINEALPLEQKMIGLGLINPN